MDLLLTTISSASYARETEAHGDCVHGEVLELIRESQLRLEFILCTLYFQII